MGAAYTASDHSALNGVAPEGTGRTDDSSSR